MMAEGSTSRADIARATGLTAATVSDLVGELISEGLVAEIGTGPSAGGKPPTLLDLNATARSVVAVDLSDGARTASVVDLKGEPTRPATRQEDVPRGQSGVDDLIATIDELLAVTPSPPLGIGVGSPGVVDPTGTVIEASNLGWRDVPHDEDVIGWVARESMPQVRQIFVTARGVQELSQLVAELGRDPGVRVLLLTGAGAGLLCLGVSVICLERSPAIDPPPSNERPR